MEPLIFAAVTCLIFLIINLTTLYDYFMFYRQFRKIPGWEGIPLIGRTFELGSVKPGTRLDWMFERIKEYRNGYYKMWVAYVPLVHIYKPQHIEAVIGYLDNTEKSTPYKYLKLFTGKGLLTSSGEKWYHDRKFLIPAFHANVMEQYVFGMIDKMQKLTSDIEQRVKADSFRNTDLFIFMMTYVLETICEAAMGVTEEDERTNEFSENMHKFFAMSYQYGVRPWKVHAWFRLLTKEGRELQNTITSMQRFTEEVIQKKRMIRKREGIKNNNTADVDDVGQRKRKAFLDLLLDENETSSNPLSDEDLRDQVNTFTIAGSETTATALYWTFVCLCLNPEVQDKIHEELDTVFRDPSEPFNLKKIPELKYLGRVLKEVLRLYPSVPFIGRRLSKNVEIDGTVVPKGAEILINNYFTHRDPEQWTNPDSFDPDRFLPENSKGRHAFAYIPFAAGPRICIGQRFAVNVKKIILCTILRKWKIEMINPPEKIRILDAMTIKPMDKIQFCLKLRT